MSAAALTLCLAGLVQAQNLPLLQETPLRTDKRADAGQSITLRAGQAVDLLQLSGGWAQVKLSSAGPGSTAVARGWVRASAIDMGALDAAGAAKLNTGRLAATSGTVPLGIRALPPRQTRHALIVGVGQYLADPKRPVAPLAGVPHDVQSALVIARRLQVPTDNIILLRDDAATRDAVERAMHELDARVQPGDRVFIYWSGHGSRYFDAAEGGCVETLVPHDLRDVSNRQFADWVQPLARKTDKLMVMYDACHSGGMGRTGPATARAFGATLTPKAIGAADAACERVSNMRGLSFERAAGKVGLDGQDIVHLSSARPDEVSFDSAESGGLATTALRDCLLGEAKDLDGSGAITVAELTACAQPRIESALAAHPQLRANHLVLSGNPAFVPAWFAASPAAAAQASPASAPMAEAVPVRQVLAQIHAQRSGKRRVEVIAGNDALRIGRDSLDLAITSSHDGHVYVAMLGSDQQSLQLLFPNTLDERNRIVAGQTLHLPRQGWRVRAAGPPGADSVLVMVTDGPRDLSALAGGRSGPFAAPLTDAEGRAQLQWLLGNRVGCDGHDCSDAFGSALLTVHER